MESGVCLHCPAFVKSPGDSRCLRFPLLILIFSSACLAFPHAANLHETEEKTMRRNLTRTLTIFAYSRAYCSMLEENVEMKKTVPFLPSSKYQTQNVMKLLEGRTGRLADLGSGDGRLVFAASSAGFQGTGFEINSILVAYARSKARWTGVPPHQAAFVKKDFWKADLSSYNNVTAFLAPGVMEELGEKLLKELQDDARVIACRFPFPSWPHQSSAGSSLDETFSYDMGAVRSHLRTVGDKAV